MPPKHHVECDRAAFGRRGLGRDATRQAILVRGMDPVPDQASHHAVFYSRVQPSDERNDLLARVRLVCAVAPYDTLDKQLLLVGGERGLALCICPWDRALGRVILEVSLERRGGDAHTLGEIVLAHPLALWRVEPGFHSLFKFQETLSALPVGVLAALVARRRRRRRRCPSLVFLLVISLRAFLVSRTFRAAGCSTVFIHLPEEVMHRVLALGLFTVRRGDARTARHGRDTQAHRHLL